MKPTGILDKGSFPGNRRRQKQGIQSGVIKTFADEPPCCEDQSLLAFWYFSNPGRGGFPLFRGHSPLKDYQMPDFVLKLFTEIIQVLFPLSQKDW